VAPAVGPATHPYHPQTTAYYHQAQASTSAVASGASAYKADAARALDHDYQARAAAEASVQQWHPEYRRR